MIYFFVVLKHLIIKANIEINRKDEFISNLVMKKSLKAIQTAIKWFNLLRNKIKLKKLKDQKKISIEFTNSTLVKTIPFINKIIEVKVKSEEIKPENIIVSMKDIRTKKRQIPKNYDDYFN